MLLFAVLVSFAIYVTLTLNRPERSFVKISQEPLDTRILDAKMLAPARSWPK
jgi:hypothetical protein